MGPSVAKELMFTARVFNGAEASKVRLNVKSFSCTQAFVEAFPNTFRWAW